MARGLQALGRLKVGAMNQTEAAYARTLELRKAAGEVAWYKFEGLKFRLADNTFYTPDFAVQLADGALEAHEVKGYMMEDANVKIKIAADMYPLRFVAVQVLSKKAGGWKVEEF
ncbi:DUF1064 domain-containing protein [Janthinobacterium sp. NKUCC06_STL]|nr:DUF1064 domain-containing protein [Janthinobacterium sp. NKUCC06_STL]